MSTPNLRSSRSASCRRSPYRQTLPMDLHRSPAPHQGIRMTEISTSSAKAAPRGQLRGIPGLFFGLSIEGPDCAVMHFSTVTGTSWHYGQPRFRVRTSRDKFPGLMLRRQRLVPEMLQAWMEEADAFDNTLRSWYTSFNHRSDCSLLCSGRGERPQPQALVPSRVGHLVSGRRQGRGLVSAVVADRIVALRCMDAILFFSVLNKPAASSCLTLRRQSRR